MRSQEEMQAEWNKIAVDVATDKKNLMPLDVAEEDFKQLAIDDAVRMDYMQKWPEPLKKAWSLAKHYRILAMEQTK